MQSHSLHPLDAVQGFGCSQQVFCNANGVCIDRHIACRCRRCIYVCPACGRYKASQCAFQIWKSFCDQDRPFSSFTWCGRLFFCSGSFRVCNRSKQGELVPTHDFWIWFYKSDFKNDCWASPKPDIQHINCADCVSWQTLNKQISCRKNRFRKIVVDSFNIAQNRNYYFRFWRQKAEVSLPKKSSNFMVCSIQSRSQEPDLPSPVFSLKTGPDTS